MSIKIRPVDGEDFYRSDRGVRIMTATYHLKRGKCCSHKCRHCPYKHTTNKSKYESVKTTILFSDIENSNGYKYSHEALQDLKVDLDHKIKNNCAFGFLGDKDVTDELTRRSDSLDLPAAAFRIENPEIDGNALSATIVPIDTPGGERLRKIMNHLTFRPVGTGVIMHNVVKSYSLSYIAAVPKDMDSFIAKH